MSQKDENNYKKEEKGDDTVSAVAINPVYKVGKPIKKMPVMSDKQINACKAAVEKYLRKGKFCAPYRLTVGAFFFNKRQNLSYYVHKSGGNFTLATRLKKLFYFILIRVYSKLGIVPAFC